MESLVQASGYLNILLPLHRGIACGKIVYECKRTMSWQPAYLRQLKRAMESNRTRWGLLVSRALPPRQSGFCLVDGVIVTTPHLAQYLVRILRNVIVELTRAQLSEDGKAAKTDEVYSYLRSDDFKNALQAIAERTKELRTSLEREKASHEGWWQLREANYSAIARHGAGVENRVHEILATGPRGRVASIRAVRGQMSEMIPGLRSKPDGDTKAV